jgi:hypothetical protein
MISERNRGEDLGPRAPVPAREPIAQNVEKIREAREFKTSVVPNVPKIVEEIGAAKGSTSD